MIRHSSSPCELYFKLLPIFCVLQNNTAMKPPLCPLCECSSLAEGGLYSQTQFQNGSRISRGNVEVPSGCLDSRELSLALLPSPFTHCMVSVKSQCPWDLFLMNSKNSHSESNLELYMIPGGEPVGCSHKYRFNPLSVVTRRLQGACGLQCVLVRASRLTAFMAVCQLCCAGPSLMVPHQVSPRRTLPHWPLATPLTLRT